ncbi:hypothetical protein LLE49_07290 [Alicyclobacillus tolerans]|uniref:hypothetical protein n=1 Tax=Alicyclobacillus tolerans TaxID=90970 RepID=UPI001F49168F|nr:hypothetical protein [Alicyclobacillus tolerans]MCF8564548.1 hypothetical protein [Alicyclobacillus tolerans]
MNVYQVNNLVIAANHVSEAFNVSVQRMAEKKYAISHDLKEGQSSKAWIELKRLTSAEIQEKDIKCCERKDGEPCKWCDGSDESVSRSWQDMIDSKDEFPCVIGHVG